MSDNRDSNRLIERVDALMRRQQEDTQRAVEEVPLLTEVVAPDAAAQSPEAVHADKALAADIERVLVVRLIPELNKQIAGQLGIHERTVKLHRTAITRKVGVHSVAELTTLTREARLFESE